MREQRLVFGEDAALYDQARPSYPAPLLDDVVALVGRGARALDIGCGTGKATVLLAARGLSGIGVEADPAMAALARRNLAGQPGWHVEVSDFEKWQPPAGSPPFDLVCSAQAWHWLDPAVRFHKAYDLLRGGGWLTLWWNRPADDIGLAQGDIGLAQGDIGLAQGDVGLAQDDIGLAQDDVDIDLAEEIEEIYAELAPEIAAKSGIGSKGSPPDDEIPSGLPFVEIVRKSYPWGKDYSPDEWVALLRTQSDHRLLPPEQLDELTERIRQLLIDRGGVYHHRYVCRLWAAQKSRAEGPGGRT